MGRRTNKSIFIITLRRHTGHWVESCCVEVLSLLFISILNQKVGRKIPGKHLGLQTGAFNPETMKT